MNLDKYPGSKTNTGIIQWLINNIPYHTRYYELFAGSAALYKHKRRAVDVNLLADLNPDTCKALQKKFADSDTVIHNCSALTLLLELHYERDAFIYLDPPYPEKARRSGAKLYKYEMLEEKQHIHLLATAKDTDANIMISTRQNDLYDIMLKDWRKAEFSTTDRVGPVNEIIYMNYPEPEILHQYDYLGNDCWDRQRVKRKIQRFTNKIQQLPAYEKHVIIQAMLQHDAAAVQHFLSVTDLPKI